MPGSGAAASPDCMAIPPVVQALVEGTTLVSRDAALRDCGVPGLW